tara:strand:- start:9048 stop:9269 length:222 start_codon:yes stop_codon:yes gene_type:complete
MDYVDQAQALEERQRTAALRRHLERLRAPAQVHGRCEGCGDMIPPARRDACPWTSFCVKCQEKEERSARGRRA